MKVTYTEEAVADIVEAITYLNARSPTAAANLDADIARCIERLAERGTPAQFTINSLAALLHRLDALPGSGLLSGGFFHCSKCVVRSNLWTPRAWPALDGLPSLAQTMVDAAALPMPVDVLEEIINSSGDAACARVSC